jgi:hypothetical protein
MYAALVDPLDLLEPIVMDFDGLPKLRRASADLMTAILETTRLRHARYCGVSSAIGEIAVRALAPLVGEGRRALLTASIDPHQAIAEAFGKRLREAGSRRLNPIMFPHTLPSATAVTMGAQFGAHVCAVALDGHGSVRDALSMAQVLLDANQATSVLLFVCVAPVGFDTPDLGSEVAGIGIILASHPIDMCVQVTPVRDPTRADSRSLKQDLRTLTWLAAQIRSEAALAEPVVLGSHMFGLHR